MRIALIFLLLAGVALAQDTTEASGAGATTPATTSAAPPAKPAGGEADAKPAAQGEGAGDAVNADVRAAGGNETEPECEEAWEYLEFLKTNIK